MDSLVDSFRKLIIDKNDVNDFDLLCNKIKNIKLEDTKEENIEEIKNILFNFFEVLQRKKRCCIKDDIFPRYIY